MTPHREPFYITTAISYPNGEPHLGHVYELVTCDAIARFHRMDARNVYFTTGTDEHGQKMLQTAADLGVTPQELAKTNSDRFRALIEPFACQVDRFIRTTEPEHHAAAQALWDKMRENGDIYLSAYEGWYSVRDEAYYSQEETEIADDDTRIGPQGTPVEWVVEESYFFRLSRYQERLLQLYRNQPDFVKPASRKNEVIRFVEGGLYDLSVSRTSFDWGVKVPDDPKHVMYVWVDALTNYITSAGYPDTGLDQFKAFWPANVHVVGKDILRFHAIYWPAFLLSAGLEPPKQVFAHGFLMKGGNKMSKSQGNVDQPMAMLEKFGADGLRYFMMRQIPYGNDGSYTDEEILKRINADLANDLGNLAQRCLTMIYKNCDQAIPSPGKFSAQDQALLDQSTHTIANMRKEMSALQIHLALRELWELISSANRYFADQAPWSVRKENPGRAHTILYVTAEIVRRCAIMVKPFTPLGANHLLWCLGLTEADADFHKLTDANALAANHPINSPTAAFPRI